MMNNFTNLDYIKLKKNSKKIFTDKNQEHQVKNIMNNEWNEIRNFPYKSLSEIKKWQLKRISFIVDYAYENIPLYRKKYDAIGFHKGDIKTWSDYEKLPILTKEELINGFPNDIVKSLDDFNLSTRSSGSSGKFVTIAVSKDAIYKDTIQGIRHIIYKLEIIIHLKILFYLFIPVLGGLQKLKGYINQNFYLLLLKLKMQ